MQKKYNADVSYNGDKMCTNNTKVMTKYTCRGSQKSRINYNSAEVSW